MKMSLMRVILGITTSLNLEVEDLYCDFNEKIYIKQLERFEVKNNEKLVCKLKKSVYGLK
jgi:hypothetical protein